MGPHSPFGHVTDYVYRVEFQKRGSPHIHGMLWIPTAPQASTHSADDICSYIDSCISCSINVSEDEKPFLKFQTHKHSRSCKRIIHGQAICRFGSPWLPMRSTQVLKPHDQDTVSNIDEIRANFVKITKYKLYILGVAVLHLHGS